MLSNNMELDSFDMVICGDEIKCKWDNDKKELYRRALREMQQKRLMNNSHIKFLKNKCKISSKNFQCRLCKKTNIDHLEAAHIGKPIIITINKIIDKYIDELSFYELFLKVIEEEDKSLITIACKKCNKELEIK